MTNDDAESHCDPSLEIAGDVSFTVSADAFGIVHVDGRQTMEVSIVNSAGNWQLSTDNFLWIKELHRLMNEAKYGGPDMEKNGRIEFTPAVPPVQNHEL